MDLKRKCPTDDSTTQSATVLAVERINKMKQEQNNWYDQDDWYIEDSPPTTNKEPTKYNSAHYLFQGDGWCYSGAHGKIHYFPNSGIIKNEKNVIDDYSTAYSLCLYVLASPKELLANIEDNNQERRCKWCKKKFDKGIKEVKWEES